MSQALLQRAFHTLTQTLQQPRRRYYDLCHHTDEGTEAQSVSDLPRTRLWPSFSLGPVARFILMVIPLSVMRNLLLRRGWEKRDGKCQRI